MTITEWPRVLLVNYHVFNLYSATGIALTNYFRNWPVERVAAVYGEDMRPDTSVCQLFYKLGGDEIRWMWPFSFLDGLGSGGRSIEAAVGVEDAGRSRMAGADDAIGGRCKRLLRRGVEILGGDALRERVRMTGRLRRWVDEFKPDVIYSTLGRLTYIRLTWKLAVEFKVPIALHIMDDWPSVIYRQGLLGPYLRGRMRQELRQVFDHATLRMGICENMCQAFRVRYGHPFIAFGSPVDVSAWLPMARKDWETHAPFRVMYVGSIVRNAQLNSLCDVSEAVSSLHASGMKIEMRIYTPWFCADRIPSGMRKLSGVLVLEAPEQAGVPALLASADLLVLPVNFDSGSVQYIRYSMPGKVAAYMISGTPILVYGPAEVAPVQYAREAGWGFVVSRSSVAAIQEAIRVLAGDMDLRSRLGRRAQELAVENHDAAKVRPAFQEALARAAAGHTS